MSKSSVERSHLPPWSLKEALLRLEGRTLSEYRFDKQSEEAVDLALAARRPLLVLGEPGVGKSRLARACADVLKRNYRSFVLDVHTESRDLLWRMDLVKRLGKAQLLASLPVAGAAPGNDEAAGVEKALSDHLDERLFLEPGPLWWAFDWEKAQDQFVRAGNEPGEAASEKGVVVLLDEIDKADSSVANGLLGALGDGRFEVPAVGAVERKTEVEAPLVVITSNEERSLPAAFLRRCIVHRLELPTEQGELIELLLERGQAHFPDMEKGVIEAAAEQLERDRSAVPVGMPGRAGQAEFLDLLRGLDRLHSPAERRGRIESLARYVFQKPRQTREFGGR